jgi:hypothetical protein
LVIGEASLRVVPGENRLVLEEPIILPLVPSLGFIGDAGTPDDAELYCEI